MDVNKYNRIYYISNYIYNNSQEYVSIKALITLTIGMNITLSQDEYNILNNKLLSIKSLINYFEYKMNIFNYMDKMNDNNLADYIVENSPLFESILKDFNTINLDIYKYLETIKSKGPSKLVPEKENIKEGTKWLYVLFDFYINHEGIKGVSCIQFFNYIKDIWDSVADSNEILYILEDMLGGISIDNISANFKD